MSKKSNEQNDDHGYPPIPPMPEPDDPRLSLDWCHAHESSECDKR